ncbi:MAG: NAD(P)-dependent oxidoreductase [Chloroflexota bacterium]
MKIVVTGGGGMLGRYLLPELATQGHEVTACDLMRPDGQYRFLRIDIMSMGDLDWAFAGADVVVHLAAIPHPLNDPPERVFAVNTQGTYNVLEAAVRAGVRRVVVASSDSAIGFGFRERDFGPEYLPLDEDHPRYPQDPYSLSKAFAEDLSAAFTRRSELQTVCLRPCMILFQERVEDYRTVLSDASLRMKGMWVYVDARDAARAFRLAAEVPDLPDHVVCNVTAADLTAREETLELLDRFYPDVPQVDRARLGGHRTVVDGSRAERLLGFRPEYSWRDWIDGGHTQ